MRTTLSAVLLIMLIITSSLYALTPLQVDGVSDSRRDTRDKDRDEAVFDAKLNALIEAGINTDALNGITDLTLRNEWVERKVKVNILYGCSITESGYDQGGQFHVTLNAQMLTSEGMGNTTGDNKFSMAKVLLEVDGSDKKARTMLNQVIYNHEKCSAVDDALYLLIVTSSELQEAKNYFDFLSTNYPLSEFSEAAALYIQDWEEKQNEDSKVYDFFAVEHPPKMKGGEVKLMKHMAKKKLYPTMAKNAGIEGIVIIEFIVDKSGKPTNLQIFQENPQGLGFGETGIKALQAMSFEPGYYGDKKVSVRMRQVIRFKLN